MDREQYKGLLKALYKFLQAKLTQFLRVLSQLEYYGNFSLFPAVLVVCFDKIGCISGIFCILKSNLDFDYIIANLRRSTARTKPGLSWHVDLINIMILPSFGRLIGPQSRDIGNNREFQTFLKTIIRPYLLNSSSNSPYKALL